MSEHQPRVGDLWILHGEYVFGVEGIEDEGDATMVRVDGPPWTVAAENMGAENGWRLVARGARTMADRALLGEFDEKPEKKSAVELLRERVAELEALCEARGVAQKQANDAADASMRVLASLLEPKPDETATDWAESVGR